MESLIAEIANKNSAEISDSGSNLEPELYDLISGFSAKLMDEKQELPTPIIPEAGFVIKTKLQEEKEPDWPKGMKIFCNLCHSASIPAPPLVAREEIVKAIQNDDSSTYKVPLSLSKPRSDMAKDGSVCLVFDACINTRPFTHAMEEEEFKFFLADLAIAWIQEKHSITLSSNYTFPKMIAKGTLVPHMIKRPARPVIKEVQKQVSTPSYTVVLEPEENPEFVVVQIHLPLLESCSEHELDLEANRLIFKALDLYFLDIPLAVGVDVESAGATFDSLSKYLHVTYKDPSYLIVKMLKCGFLGPLGTYSHQAALEIMRKRGQESSIIFEALVTIPSLFQCSLCDYIVVPIENSTSGCVAQTLQALYAVAADQSLVALSSLSQQMAFNSESLDALPSSRGSAFKVVDQTAISINHCFLKHPKTDINNIQKVYSHPEALAQCTLWLQKHYPTAQLVPVSSTAHGAKLASTDYTSASISNRVCAELYRLDIVADGLAPSANTTRFLLLQRGAVSTIASAIPDSSPRADFSQAYRTLILHEPKQGMLSQGMQIASLLSLDRAFSKPLPVRFNPTSTAPLWSYFYLYIAKGHETDEKLKEIVDNLLQHSHLAVILGSFPTE